MGESSSNGAKSQIGRDEEFELVLNFWSRFEDCIYQRGLVHLQERVSLDRC